jgi:hypothetical protein
MRFCSLMSVSACWTSALGSCGICCGSLRTRTPHLGFLCLTPLLALSQILCMTSLRRQRWRSGSRATHGSRKWTRR